MLNYFGLGTFVFSFRPRFRKIARDLYKCVSALLFFSALLFMRRAGSNGNVTRIGGARAAGIDDDDDDYSSARADRLGSKSIKARRMTFYKGSIKRGAMLMANR